MDNAALPPALPEAVIPELPGFVRGKVRDCYDLPSGERLLIASDRLSAFDRILAVVPGKGRVLTQTARHWFEATADICPNHVIAYPDPNALLARRLSILPVEVVVRGYLAGTTSTSILTLYRAGAREVYGHRLPEGMRPNEALPTPIITPTTKAEAGGHDAPLTETEIVARGILPAPLWDEVRTCALALFARGQTMAAARGLILADTKYEFGIDAAGTLRVGDEIHTPDSSRFWIAQSYGEAFASGRRPLSFDKDMIRAWVAERCDPYNDPIPPIPPEIIAQTAAVYRDAYAAITGRSDDLTVGEDEPLVRLRRNLAPWFTRA